MEDDGMKVHKKKICITIGVAFLVVVAIGIWAMADDSQMEKWGGILKEQSQNYSDEVYAIGDMGEVLRSEIEQCMQFYMLSGMNEEEAMAQAEDYMLKREALYQEAIKQGYIVTDEEIWEYIDELKEFAEQADNKGEIQSIMNQFESEEAYWEYEFEVYKKNLPIQKYVKNVETEFKHKQQMKKNNNIDLETEWTAYFEEMKNQLLEEANFEIVK